MRKESVTALFVLVCLLRFLVQYSIISIYHYSYVHCYCHAVQCHSGMITVRLQMSGVSKEQLEKSLEKEMWKVGFK